MSANIIFYISKEYKTAYLNIANYNIHLYNNVGFKKYFDLFDTGLLRTMCFRNPYIIFLRRCTIDKRKQRKCLRIKKLLFLIWTEP